jgi:predicted TPR repeat methyltransferase
MGFGWLHSWSLLQSCGMGNLFDTPAMAAGYAKSRPEVHPHILERARKLLPMPLPVEHALDVGCGAGLSTRALQVIARHPLGIDPSEAMVKCASALVPAAKFMVGSAESLSVPSRSMDLITAAGSLNYVDLSRFFPEAVRLRGPQQVLSRSGAGAHPWGCPSCL